MENIQRFMLSGILLIIIVIYYFVKNQDDENIKIGFIGSLTGKYSVLSNDMMNGVTLALDEINHTVDDKKIKLVIKDDKNDKEVNEKAINSFIKEDIKIVIGNATSTMSAISMNIINKYNDMVMISASSASTQFSNKDDNFFRVHVENSPQRFDNFTSYLLKNNLDKVYAIYDPLNEKYTKNYIDNFEKSFIKQEQISFIQKTNKLSDLNFLINDINSKRPSLVLIAANSVDSANIIQTLKLNNIDTRFALAEWSLTKSFIQNTGSFANGVLFNIDFDVESQNQNYLEFKKAYTNKYHKEPSMYAAKSYELTNIIIKLLKENKQQDIKKALLKQREFEGLQNMIVFDKYGDLVTNFYTFEVKDGNFVKVDD